MKKIFKKIIAGSLAFVCAITAGVAAVATNGFGLFNAAQGENVNHNNQLSFGDFFGYGITLTASAETAIQSSTVADCGDISSLGTVNPASAPFGYRDLTLYENSTITKVGVPVLSVSDYTSENLFTLYVVSYDEPLTTFTQVLEYKLKIPANTFSSNTVNAWHYFDVNITVGDNQTLAFGSTVDTVTWGYGANRNDSQRIFYTKTLGSSYTQANEANCLYFDVYTSDSTTPSVSTGAQRLTATITPEDALDSKVNWTISWKNPVSTWANGKAVTDYVTLTPSTDNGLIADVECLQAFGEQVVVGVELVSNTEIKSSCTVDYIKRVSDVKIGKMLNGTIFESSTLVFGAENAFGAIVTYSDGTIEGKLSFGALTAEMNSTFQSKVKEYMTDVTTSYTFKSSTLTSNFVDGASILLEYPKDMFITVFGDTSVVHPKFTNGFYQACMLVSGMHGTLSVPYEYSYGETIINSGISVSDQIRFSTDNLSYEVTNIDLDYGSIVF